MAVPTDMLSGQEGSQRVVSTAPSGATTTVPPQNAPVIGQSNPAGFVLE
jgi:hypothetical protein